MKKAFCTIIAVILLFSGTFIGLKINKNRQINALQTEIFPITSDMESMPVNLMQGCLLFDTTDKAKHVGVVDYVFVARIDELIGTSYEDVTQLSEGKIYATPFTNYQITVLHNIKGSLKTNESIPFRKFGGIDIGGETVSMFEDDWFPKVGELYIFLAYADSNGELYIADPDSSILLGNATEYPNLTNKFTTSMVTSDTSPFSSVINEYVEAYEEHDNSIERGTRYPSRFDTNVVA